MAKRFSEMVYDPCNLELGRIVMETVRDEYIGLFAESSSILTLSTLEQVDPNFMAYREYAIITSNSMPVEEKLSLEISELLISKAQQDWLSMDDDEQSHVSSLRNNYNLYIDEIDSDYVRGLTGNNRYISQFNLKYLWSQWLQSGRPLAMSDISFPIPYT